METIVIFKNNDKLVFKIGDQQFGAFDIDDFMHDISKVFPYSQNFISIEVMRGGKLIDTLRTTTQKDKYSGDTGEMMFSGVMANSEIIRNWRRKNPHFLGITQCSDSICPGMFQEGDILRVEHSFASSLKEILIRAR